MSERNLVETVRNALDDSLEQMDEATRARLYAARRGALSASRAAPSGADILVLARHHARAVALILVVGLALAVWFGTRTQPQPESNNVDILLLTGDIPPQAYADWRLVRREDVGPQCPAVN